MPRDREELRKLRKDLVPLCAAAALAYQRVYGDAHRGENVRSNEHAQNVMAHALAVYGTVYSFDVERTTIAALDANALKTGVFRDGAERLFFYDGRPQLTRLAVRSADLQKAIKVLIETKVPFEGIPVPDELRRKPSGDSTVQD